MVPSKLDLEEVGHYRVLGQAGKGGMASVYIGEDLAGGPRVALKVFSPRDLSVMEFRRRVKREIMALKQCTHPHVVRILDFDLECAQPYLALEYLDGEHLGTLLKVRGPFSPHEVARIAG